MTETQKMFYKYVTLKSLAQGGRNGNLNAVDEYLDLEDELVDYYSNTLYYDPKILRASIRAQADKLLEYNQANSDLSIYTSK